MRTALSRLINSQSPLSRSRTPGLLQSRRLLSNESNRIDEQFKVEEAETIKVPPPPSEKLLVLGGNGFVGSHVCKEALEQGLPVSSLSRSGRSTIRESWADKVEWNQGNLLVPDSLPQVMDGVTAVEGPAEKTDLPWMVYNKGCMDLSHMKILVSPKHTALQQQHRQQLWVTVTAIVTNSLFGNY